MAQDPKQAAREYLDSLSPAQRARALREAAEDYWHTEVQLPSVPKSEFSEYRIALETKPGKRALAIRVWYWTRYDATPKPTREGMNIPIEVAGDVHAVLDAALGEAYKLGWLR